MTAPPLLTMEGITKTFPGVRALEQVNLHVASGEIHALIGKNGAGKSTLIKILGGVYQPDEGRILIAGKEVKLATPQAAIAHGIAIVHQELSLVPVLSVAENIFLGRWRTRGGCWNIQWNDLRREAGNVLRMLTSEIDPRALVENLSVAQQQHVEIAKALSHEPRILVMDEPTSSLSNQDGERLLKIVRTLANSGVTIIFISHRLTEVEQVADQITVLRDGRTVGTSERAKMDRAGIVQLMLGKELTQADVRPPRPARDRVVLSVRHLCRRGVLNDVSFELHEGEILGLAGLVGDGRTELVRAIFGRDRIDSGEIYIAGANVHKPTPSRMRSLGIGLIPEDRKSQGLVLGSTVRENIVLAVLTRLTRLGLLKSRSEATLVDRLITELQIVTPSRNAVVRTLSGGNQQKVVIAKWLARRPRVLILDEPTRGIDVQAKAQILTILDRLATEGVGIIFISSELEEVVAISHRILTMSRGRIVDEMESHKASMQEIMLSATGI
ncbi:MAG TPA: sugar ABC transporter ATP-binding protein [Chthoniobacterales bacterium]|nr:sugar ABC transporter ATP-binding protein [Chthoniobacterales bacterium]